MNRSIVLPTAFSTESMGEAYLTSADIDLSLVFWNKILSRDFIARVFSADNENLKSFLGFFHDNVEYLHAVLDGVFREHTNVVHLKYAFEVLDTYLALLNASQREYIVSLSHGIALKAVTLFKSADEIDTPLLSTLIEELLGGYNFTSDDSVEIFVYWFSTIPISQILAHILRTKYGIRDIVLNFSTANEQSDYTVYRNSSELLSFFKEIVAEKEFGQKTNQLGLSRKFFSENAAAMRLLKGKCHWNKCRFCTINAGREGVEASTSVTDEVKESIESCIAEIKARNITCFTFGDEALTLDIVEHIATRFLDQGIHVRWSVRMRIDRQMARYDLGKLRRSGLVLIGIGLETVSNRVAGLMNKRDFTLSHIDIYRINKNFERSGINVHYYMILGFPGELTYETDRSERFMRSILRLHIFGSYTPNVFYLMKNSYVYEHPEEFAIHITNRTDSVTSEFEHVAPFLKYDRDELFFRSITLFRNMFYEKGTNIFLGYRLWDFLDYTVLFYYYKMRFSRNPFLEINKRARKLRKDASYALQPVWFVSSSPTVVYSFSLQKELRVSVERERAIRGFCQKYLGATFVLADLKADAAGSGLSERDFCYAARFFLKAGYLVSNYDLQYIEA